MAAFAVIVPDVVSVVNVAVSAVMDCSDRVPEEEVSVPVAASRVVMRDPNVARVDATSV